MLVKSKGPNHQTLKKPVKKEFNFYPVGNREPLRVLCRGRKLSCLHGCCDKDEPGMLEAGGRGVVELEDQVGG